MEIILTTTMMMTEQILWSYKNIFLNRVFNRAIFSVLPKHISNSNIHWPVISFISANQKSALLSSLQNLILESELVKLSILLKTSLHVYINFLLTNLHVLQNPTDRVK